MNYDKLIINGLVVLPDQVKRADIGIKDGKIAAVGQGLCKSGHPAGELRKDSESGGGPLSAGGRSGAESERKMRDGIQPERESRAETEAEVIDALGLYVFPGVVDGHVHLCEPGRTEWEGFETGTMALAAGGTTCYVDMPLNNLPATTDGETMRLKKKCAKGKNYVDYSLYGGLVPDNTEKLWEMKEEGAAACKCFVASCGSGVPGDFKNVDDYRLLQGMKELKRLGLTLSVHCENAAICDGLAGAAVREGRTDMRAYLDSRPKFAEVEAVRRVLYFGKVTGCRIHFVHLSCAEAVDEVTAARKAGMEVTAETCPHYLSLTDEDCIRIGADAKCSPPIRSRIDADRLWERVLLGKVDILASDHSPCPPDMKECGGDIFRAWGGISACQNMLDLMFDEAVKKRGMEPYRLAALLSENPAHIFGLSGKGSIRVGKDADLVFLNPGSPYRVTEERLYYRHPHSAYLGREIGCRVEKTFVRGRLVYDWERGITGAPEGRFVRGGSR